jgi:hypothetical protein
MIRSVGCGATRVKFRRLGNILEPGGRPVARYYFMR